MKEPDHFRSRKLLHNQIDKKLVLVIERADRLHRTLLAVILRPYLVVGVLRKLPEPVPTLVIGKKLFTARLRLSFR